MMEPFYLILLSVIGVVAGYINVMSGGGSVLTVPALLFLGLPGPVANGTNRIALLFQNITAVYIFFRKGYHHFRLSVTLALCTLPGAFIGAFLATKLTGIWFNRFVAVVMVLVMLAMYLQKNKTDQSEKIQLMPKRNMLGHLLMVFAGFWGGIIQVGAGFILMPILHRVMGLSLVETNMHKVFVVLCYTILALFVFALTGDGVVWLAGLALAVGNSTGAWLATHTMIKYGEQWIRWVFNIVIMVIIIKLIMSA